MRLLSLDLSTKTGYAIFDDGNLVSYGKVAVSILNFNVNDRPEKQTQYPANILLAANQMAAEIEALIQEFKPDQIVIENTVRGMNRNTQRLLEFIHFAVLTAVAKHEIALQYMDPSEWRSIVGLRLSSEQKKHNVLVSKGIVRGRVTQKHLSVEMVNIRFRLNLKLQDNDQADAILLGVGCLKVKHEP